MAWTQWPALITWLTLILLLVLAADVARARGRYAIHAPATTGNEQFERVFRTQMNTLENAVVFLPALWLAAWYWTPAWAGVCGAVWLVGRIWYARAYARDAGRRGPGLNVSMAGLVALLAGSAIGWARAFAWT
jgi:glutathione S-transferase